jgi:sulfotransferase
MTKTIHYTSGLPRACSTLLQNLLAQNPEVHATATSGVHEIMYIAKGFFKTDEFRSIPNPTDGEKIFIDFMHHGIAHAFDSITDRPIVVDKCRSWIGSIGLLLKINPDAKILIPVRDIRGVLSSLEKKYQQHPEFQMEMSQQDTMTIQTVEGRVRFWLEHPPVGIAIQRLHEIARLHKDKVHFVSAEALTNKPKETMLKVWNYLGIPSFEHNFDNVEQYTKEHELGWPFGEHSIKNSVKPLPSDWNDVLGKDISNVIQQKFNWVTQL